MEQHVHFVKKDNTLLSIEEIQEAGKEDPELQKVVSAINARWSNTDENLRKWTHLEDELTYAQGLLWRGRGIFVLAKLRAKALDLVHEAHQARIVRSKQLRPHCFGLEWIQKSKTSAATAKLVYDCKPYTFTRTLLGQIWG